MTPSLRLAATAGLLAAATLLALAAPATQAPPSTLDQVFAAIDHAAPHLNSLEAQATADDYTAMVQDDTKSTGKLDFKKTGQGPMYALDFTKPADAAKRLVYRDHNAYVYNPASRQVQIYPLGDKQNLLNQFLLLGLGSTASDLTHAYTVSLVGPATVNGFETVELNLVPLDPAVAAKISHINLWYDTKTWIAVQVQLWEGTSGDYHKLQYTNLKPDIKLDDTPFDTTFNGATRITPHT